MVTREAKQVWVPSFIYLQSGPISATEAVTGRNVQGEISEIKRIAHLPLQLGAGLSHQLGVIDQTVLGSVVLRLQSLPGKQSERETQSRGLLIAGGDIRVTMTSHIIVRDDQDDQQCRTCDL